MIPKTIHYIWLGEKPLPKIAEKCIGSWKKLLPDFEIKRWDETNLNIDICNYCRTAYDAKKFAFASDVLRFDILNREGGIYLDIDVEILKPLDKFLTNKLFSGFEVDSIAPGLILGSEKNQPILKKMLDIYKYKTFLIDEIKTETVCTIFTELLVINGLEKNNTFQKLSGDIVIYPSEYFCPINIITSKKKITKNTHAIHHYASTWYTPAQKFKHNIKVLLNKLSFGNFGKKIQKKKDLK